MSAIELPRADGDSEVAACSSAMGELRPHLAHAAKFIALIARQQKRLLGAWHDGMPVALTGERLAENLVYGRFVSVDDLVATKNTRAAGIGGWLLEAVAEKTRMHGIERLVLDTALDNVLARRLYYRQGLPARALRFSRPIAR